jgi:hypothetical protein
MLTRVIWEDWASPNANKRYNKCGFNVIVETFELFTCNCAGWQLSNNLIPHLSYRQPLPPMLRDRTNFEKNYSMKLILLLIWKKYFWLYLSFILLHSLMDRINMQGNIKSIMAVPFTYILILLSSIRMDIHHSALGLMVSGKHQMIHYILVLFQYMTPSPITTLWDFQILQEEWKFIQ